MKLLGENISNFYLRYNFISKRSFTNLILVIFPQFVISSSFTLGYINVKPYVRFLARSGVIVSSIDRLKMRIKIIKVHIFN